MAMLIPAYSMRFGQSFGWGGTMIFSPGDLPSTFKDMCGSGVHGEVVRSVNGDEGYLFTESYTVEAGVTMSVIAGRKGIIIFAQDLIKIAGTINADYKGAAGGVKGTAGNDGNPGGNGIMGGAGGRGGNCAGQSGGIGGIITDEADFYEHFVYDKVWDLLRGEVSCGGGGGGGAGGVCTGADGGAGGGYVILIAPRVQVMGTIKASGEDGDPRSSESCAGNPVASGGGGGGGFIWVVARNIIDGSATYTINGGAGGELVPPGEAGLAGSNGVVKKIIVR